MNEYGQRNADLQKLGFRNYEEYLQSKLWAEIREATFALKGRCCTLCKEEATQVHHELYDIDVLEGRCLRYLWPICYFCHHKIEYFPNGVKREFQDVQKVFRRLRCGYDDTRPRKRNRPSRKTLANRRRRQRRKERNRNRH